MACGKGSGKPYLVFNCDGSKHLELVLIRYFEWYHQVCGIYLAILRSMFVNGTVVYEWITMYESNY